VAAAGVADADQGDALNRDAEIWLAELATAARALKPRDEPTRRALAALLGLESRDAAEREPEPEAAAAEVPDAIEGEPELEDHAGEESDEDALPRLTPSATEAPPIQRAWAEAEPLEPFSEERHTAAALRYEPLFDPRWTASLLASAAAGVKLDGAIDEHRIVAWISHGRPVTSVPRLPRATTSTGVRLLIDMGEGMEPFRRDVRALAARLRRIAGRTAVKVARFQGAPSAAFVEPGVPALVLSDLGCSGMRSPPLDSWRGFARALAAQGSPAFVFVPFPRERWPRGLGRHLTVVEWDRRSTAASVYAARAGRRA
jgi:hypothetical protein